MQFKNASAIESLTWEMRLADFPRSLNRAKINDLFNGFPPYSQQEVEDNQIEVNVNYLDAAQIAHNARRQFTTAFLNPDPLFTVSVDYGPIYRRREWGERITREINKVIKQSLPYMEVRRSTFASLVLHGIGPSIWRDKESWCPLAIGVEDSLLPSGTLLTMENLPFFAVYQQYTGFQLQKMISGPRVDPAWNLDLAKSAIRWVDQQASQLMSASWPEVWSPEKWSEREKEDSGLYSSDRVPTVDAFDFYFWNDDGKRSGWERRIVLDAYGQPGAGGLDYKTRPKRKMEFGENEFLYDSSRRKNSKYADKIDQIIHWQFADGSSVAPFRYHSVRSLGFLLFAVCHLQNRLRCKFNEAVFESLLQYFRVHNADDAERAIKINLINRGMSLTQSPNSGWRNILLRLDCSSCVPGGLWRISNTRSSRAIARESEARTRKASICKSKASTEITSPARGSRATMVSSFWLRFVMRQSVPNQNTQSKSLDLSRPIRGGNRSNPGHIAPVYGS